MAVRGTDQAECQSSVGASGLRTRHLAIRLASAVLALTCFSNCKAFDSKKSSVPVRQRNPDELPPMEPRAANADAAAAFMRPAAALPGTAVLMVGESRSCMATRVAENFLLTAASCVFDPLTGYPRPSYLYRVQLTLGWKSGDEQKTAEIESVAVYAHESYLKHFAATKEKPSRETYSDKAALAQVADLALIEFQARKPGAELAIATIADALPPLDGTSKATLLALQGFCGVQSAEDQEAKKKPAFLDGGRSLSATWQPDVLRGYLTDVFKSTRALFDCEGFRGAPVYVEGATSLIGVTSWMHEGSTERGVTLVAGDASKQGSLRNWVTERIKAKRDFKEPALNTALSCKREVGTSIGNFSVELSNWPVLFDEKRVVVSYPIFSLDLTITVPPADQKKEGVTPLALAASEGTAKQTFKMVRDVRQSGFLQFVTADKITLGKEDVSVTFVSTDGETALVIVAAAEQGKSERERKERSVNIFLDKFDGQWCTRKPVAAPEAAKE